MVELVKQHNPGLIGLQETKVQDSEFPLSGIQELGYEALFHGQKSHYGVALLYRLPLLEHEFGLPWDAEDAQRRMIRATFQLPDGQKLLVFNGYFPQGDSRTHEVKFPYKRKFYQDLYRCLSERLSRQDRLVIMGDMNVSPADTDIGIGEDNRKRWLSEGKCSFLPEERQWYERLLDWGLTDSFRLHYPDIDNVFSWFDYRSRAFEKDPKRGLRIDHILLSEALLGCCKAAGIDTDIRAMAKPSDHCPIWVELAL